MGKQQQLHNIRVKTGNRTNFNGRPLWVFKMSRTPLRPIAQNPRGNAKKTTGWN